MIKQIVKLFVKNSEDVKNPRVREGYGRLGGGVGILGNLFLCGIKITVGLLTGSMSIIADGLNNLSDMGSAVVTLIGLKLAGKPADNDHPFGHGRMEYMSAFVVAVLILLVGFQLMLSSVKTLIGGGASPKYSLWAVAVLSAGVLIKLWMFFFNRYLGKKTNSAALIATAADCINDVVTTSAILLSVGISALFDLPFNLDAVMALGVALFILWSGISTAKNTLDEILGGPPDRALIEEIERTILSFEEFVGLHDLMVHDYGPGRQFASVHVEVPLDSDIVRCHEQIDLCEKLISEKLGLSLVIHMDPIDVNDETVAAVKAAMCEAISTIDERMSLHDFRMTPAGSERTNLIFDVVVPSSVRLSDDQLNMKIGKLARLINPTYCCVITYDQDFSGRGE